MRMIVHDFKVKLGEHISMTKFPANMHRDDDVKTYILHFIAQQWHEKIVSAAIDVEDIFSGAKSKGKTDYATLTSRKLNTLSITASDSPMSLYQLSADDDIFQDFSFLKYPSKATILTM